MAERGIFRTATDRDLMRDINYTFDENASAFIVGGFGAELSSGTPIEVLQLKGRLLESIAYASGFAIGTEWPSWFEQENTQLRMENYVLRERIRAIEERLADVEANVTKERTVVLREISREEAKEEIRNLFSTERTLYYSDIAKELGLDLEMVVDICSELQKSGEISIDAGVS